MTLETFTGERNPQEASRIEHPGIDQALERGNRLHGFLSGGGLRVIRLELDGELKGYGEHPNVDEALIHASEDFSAGGRDYYEVYGKLYPHYLTGSSEITSPLDGWLLRGRTIDAYRVYRGKVRVELTGMNKKIAETGEGQDFNAALNQAFQAQEI